MRSDSISFLSTINMRLKINPYANAISSFSRVFFFKLIERENKKNYNCLPFHNHQVFRIVFD